MNGWCSREPEAGSRVAMLRELYRTLRNYITDRLAFGNANGRPWPDSVAPVCFILNYELRRYGHQLLYDPATLRDSPRAESRFATLIEESVCARSSAG